MEVQYRLQAFGISIPVDQNGNLKIKKNSEYIDSLIQRERGLNVVVAANARDGTPVAAGNESSSSTTSNRKEECATTTTTNNKGNSGSSIKDDGIDDESPLIETPNANDVLLQRGKIYQSHHGNVQLTKLVEKYRAQYNAAQRQIEKSTINQLIVQLIHESGGRFLMRDKEDTGKWKEVPNELAWERVARRYRK